MLLTYVNNKGGEAMPRPCRKRKVCRLPRYAYFGPNPSATKTVVLSIDEYETIRLMDLEGLTQQECAKQMDVARTTVQSIYEQARYKLAQSIVRGYSLKIEGGNYSLCDKAHLVNCTSSCTIKNKRKMEDNRMKIAVTNGQGHSALAEILKNLNIDVLICGGIGGGARNILTSLGIEIIPGVIGSSDEAVIDYLKGELHYDPNTACNHHDDGHHACQEHDNKCCH